MGERAVEFVGKGLVPDGGAAAASAGWVAGLNLRTDSICFSIEYEMRRGKSEERKRSKGEGDSWCILI